MSTADYQRRWRAKQGGTGQPGRTASQPCGSVAAYRRHLRAGETPCDSCREANAEKHRALYLARAAKKQRSARPTLEERFWAKIDRSGGPDACWPWTGARNRQGYGSISSTRHRGGAVSAHRLSWELANGRLPAPTLMVLHSCDNPPCANPTHLREGDSAANAADHAERAPCGTVSAWKRHQRHGEAPCGPCRAAWAEYQRALYARRRA